MGRLQRKKTSGAKKKKKKKAGSAASVKSQTSIAKPGKATASLKGGNKAAAEKAAIAKKKPQVSGVAAAKPKTNIFQLSIQFLREVKIELKKVTWPSRKQTIGSTVVVVALVLLISLFLGFVDIGLSNLIRAVLQ